METFLPTPKQRKTFTLNVGGPYRLTRLTDLEYDYLRRKSIAIQEVSAFFEHDLCRSSRLSLGKFYASMKCLFGERGQMFDDWKGAFSFPLALEVPGAPRRPAYLLNVTDFRGGVEHRFRELVDRSDPRLENPVYYAPDPKVLSQDKIERFLAYLVGFQSGYYETAGRQRQETFLLSVESNHILYGFDGRRFFEKSIVSEKTFTRRRSQLAKHLPAPGFYADE
ncbi:MAG: hypothetical protein HY721_16815 [Planctomycetes bacterium]|nr:hypothetical protein [Planctomycetota bacterium]